METYIVTLTAEKRQTVLDLIAVGRGAAQKLTHARILLKADAAEGRPVQTDVCIAETPEVSVATVERVRQRFVEQGVEAALVRKPTERPRRRRTLDGQAEARLIALACSAPTDGQGRWTMIPGGRIT